MSQQLFDILRFTLLFLIGGPVMVEVIGYFWHRGAEHEGWLGNVIRYRHWIHHERDYPTTSLRPGLKEYKSAGSWSWYLLSTVVLGTLFWLAPMNYALPLALGGVVYALGFVNYFHQAFHVRGHWLHSFRWFQRLVFLHDVHHYQPGNYGIVFFGMDRLCGTFRETIPPKAENNFPRLQVG